MTFKILALGDVCGPEAVDFLSANLRKIRRETGADFVCANCENASQSNGLTKEDAEYILNGGVDLITSGNHIWKHSSVYSLLDERDCILRPANYPGDCPGFGASLQKAGGVTLLCMNIRGNMYMPDSLADPFDTVEGILKKYEGEYDISLLDIHAEATSEKQAIARYFDGRISVVFGTHTHVQTADARVLQKGTGYITDLGMCGPAESVLGVKEEIIIKSFRTRMPQRFDFAEGPCSLQGAVFTVDTASGKTSEAERFFYK